MTASKNKTPGTPPEQPAPEPAPEPAPTGSSQAQQASAAASAAITGVREKLVAGEQLVLGAALVIVVVSYFIFDFLFNFNTIVSDFSVLLAVLTILAIWVHRWGHYDFGKAYRIVIGALGVSLALLALINLLAWARLTPSVDFVELLGRLTYWASGVAAFVGAWQVFRTRAD
jgi:hypothetical protein